MKQIQRQIETKHDELQCIRSVAFKRMPASVNDKRPMIRVYGGHACAVLQLRGHVERADYSQGAPMFASASYLDANEIDALIAKLTEIRATLHAGNFPQLAQSL